MRFLTRRRGEQGSIAITMSVAFIATALSAATLTTIYRNIRTSRYSGDTANALQVADAGLNDAIKSLKTAVGTVGTCPNFPTLPGFARTDNIAGGTYTFCAAQDVDSFGRTVWHIDAVGRDATGEKRRLRSDAVSTPLFPNAINVIATGDFASGFSVDSFKDELNRCTGKGKVGTNDPQHLKFGNQGNNSSENCQNNPNGKWPYPPDGCVAYSRDGTVGFPSTVLGQTGQCPPEPYSAKEAPEFSPKTPAPPGTYHFPAQGTGPGESYTCDAPGKLQAGKTYYFGSVTLAENCAFPVGGPYPSMTNPTRIFTTSLTLAGGQGASSLNPINLPPNNSAVCGLSHGQLGANPLYCPGWAGGLQIEVIGNGKVQWTGNHSTFWGVINAPSATVEWKGGGGSQWEIWGSLVAGSLTGAVQAKWHYDENLGQLTSGAFFGKNWREEPLQ